ncbi:SMC family ATPase [Oscillatoria sp. FACHB-1407]|uniref:AAA family ATPase n=1 Tax=Oscillatoria sp. FACHB-1407 TaxID=2692847 RepID=UPI00168A11C3|nr:SMC family ATPase [Oscillatoria sp. FACHB-1407]MBD2464391.1 SMC family ATPase [Oscillatoria sp. FACHB-1407]
MEILSVTLKNFKSHSDRHFLFQLGTNAICGENGAGKTSILEAIAWTLFNYRGAYKNEDMIRNGASSAQASVSFVSSRDGRTYSVQRCTTKGYTIYDPQLDQRLDYKHIDEEVMPWLRQHLGVAPGTDLGKLFANTIGVPQGTFTAAFLETTENRKKVFDAVLKVEEYKQVYAKLGSLKTYSEAQVEQLEQAIAKYTEDLSNWEVVHQRHTELQAEITQDETKLQTLQLELAKLHAEKTALATQVQQIQQLEAQLKQVTAQIEGQQRTSHILEEAVERAKQAVAICETHQAGYQAFLQAEAALQECDRQTKQRQTLLKQREKQHKLLSDRHTELTRLTVQLEGLQRAEAEIAQLQPLLQQQVELEQQQAAIADHLQQLQTCRLEQQTIAKQLTKAQTDGTRLAKDIERLQSLADTVDQIEEWEHKRDRLQEQLSRIEAAKQFEADLRQLVQIAQDKRDRHHTQAKEALAILQQMQASVPLLATHSVDSALAAIQAGVDLNSELLQALQEILADLSEQTSVAKLKQQSYDLKLKLEAAYRHQAEYASLNTKLEQQTQLNQDIAQLQTRIQQLEGMLSTEAGWQERRSHLNQQLTQLGDPRSRQHLLTQQLQQQAQIQAQYAQLQQIQASIQQAIADLDSNLEQFADLDDRIEQQKQLRQVNQSSHLTYVQYQKDAASLPQRIAEWQTAIAQVQQLQAHQQTLTAEYDQLQQNYDPQHWQQVETAYAETRSQVDRIQGSLPQQRKLLAELEQQLTHLKAIAEERDRTQLELKQAERNKRFIKFARDAYKKAGPRITERYVQNISHEADKLFRELMNRPNVALEWTRDYEIIVQEGAHTRRFINLSGGEQMCAALAVRLALLRVLADIDIAFFDEPTTNMDRPRRESLAEAIANIRTFRQLFVISHDDTFEKVTENVILVQRE